MTEYELVDAIASYNSAGGTFFTTWVSILSAYAITSYAAGKKASVFSGLSGSTLCMYLHL